MSHEKNDIIKINPDRLWNVIASDDGFWRVGIYRPNTKKSADVKFLERHSCPELFVCVKGRMALVLFDGVSEKIIEMDPGDALLVNGFHNGFRMSEGGYFIVSERTDFTTNYINRESRTAIDRDIALKLEN
jgi:hypothetical protein